MSRDDMLRDTVRAFFAKESPPSRVRAAEQAAPPGFDASLWSKAALSCRRLHQRSNRLG